MSQKNNFIFLGLLILISFGIILGLGLNLKSKTQLEFPPEKFLSGIRGFLYIKNEKDSKKIMFYDLKENQKKVISEYKERGISIELIQPSIFPKNEFFFVIKDLSGVTDKGNPVYNILKVKIADKIETIELAKFYEDIYFFLQPIIISPDKEKIAYCGEKGLVVYNLISNEKKIFSEEVGRGVCDFTASNLTFSRDGKKIFYIRSFYELYGDFTEEEIKKMAKEAGNGLRVIDLEKGQDILLLPSWSNEWSDPIFYNSSQVDLKNKIYWERDGNKFKIRKLEDTNFDYLLQKEIAKFPLIFQFEVKLPDNREIEKTVFSEKGDGFFYIARGKPNELGFLEIESAKNYFPLPFALKEVVIQQEGFSPVYHWPEIFSAFSKETLFYFIESPETRLYWISVGGKEELTKMI
jgi:hypothetical protein